MLSTRYNVVISHSEPEFEFVRVETTVGVLVCSVRCLIFFIYTPDNLSMHARYNANVAKSENGSENEFNESESSNS